nr:DUF4238 domain-containing protein [uncultured Tolumonas sp.]
MPPFNLKLENIDELPMNIPKKQHYVPQFILRNFTVGKKKKIYVFDTKTQNTFTSHVREIGHENDFYNHPINGNQIEFDLGTLETQVAPLISGILEQGSINHLSDTDFYQISYFTIIQMMRVNALRESISNISEILVNRLKNETLVPGSQAELLFKDAESKNEKLLSLDFIKTIPLQLMPNMLDKHLSLLKAPKGKHFYISDNPVVKYNNLYQSRNDSVGLGVKGIEISFPISPKYMLSFSCPILLSELRNSINSIENKDSINSDRYVGLRVYVNSIDNKTTQTLNADNVQHYNALQATQSSRFIYSFDNDFSLIRTMIKDNNDIFKNPRVVDGSKIFLTKF